MKKVIPSLLLACVLFACKKNTAPNESPASESKIPVNFSLTNFLVSQEDMSANGRVQADPSLSGFKKIFYMAFKSDGSPYNYIVQDSTDINFGNISDSLFPGTYTVALGAWNRKGLYNSNITTNHSRLDSAAFNSFNAKPTGDFFYKKLQVTVSNGITSHNDVTLNRIVGLLKVELKDALPASDTSGAVSVSISGVPQTYLVNADIASYNYGNSSIDRTSQTTWEYYLFGSTNPLSLTIYWKDRLTGAPQSKTISNVVVSANKKTIVTGYLYGIPTNVAGSFVMKTNQTWSSDSTVISIN
ncbi:hypothetical protein A4H97_04840 [Niastella yeongjuensis]|uniref:Uncharacterized protein n=1 Tax=Niastella yeongjuensis TaxID=354355 RepID=A0A1V9EL32_9BACT|nr:FimB/Mfa2 family fimbrial subunit [Niastella yeongjuensis]OQP46853.1 hypothetical protein A4H97_04840 [Niastella yeongjuensis]SEN57240.1 hypothetical protein SAMN05660816_00991 [Niastella yeongjuensis]